MHRYKNNYRSCFNLNELISSCVGFNPCSNSFGHMKAVKASTHMFTGFLVYVVKHLSFQETVHILTCVAPESKKKSMESKFVPTGYQFLNKVKSDT